MPLKAFVQRLQRHTSACSLKKAGWALALFLFGFDSAYGQDTLALVLGRLKVDTVNAVAYREIRHLSLLASPWQGAGLFYAAPPDVLIKAQTLPEQETVAVVGDRYYFLNANSGRKADGKITDQPDVLAPITVFRSLINGHATALKQYYTLGFSSDKKGWLLTLTALQQNPYKVELHGLTGNSAGRLKLIRDDGDYDDYVLAPVQSGEKVQTQLRELMAKLGVD
jgi:hypothetical protein